MLCNISNKVLYLTGKDSEGGGWEAEDDDLDLEGIDLPAGSELETGG